MDTRNVETFVVAARYLSFVHAARELHLSQPSVSARIQCLEDELGTPLFIRKGKNLILSRAGEAFLPYARRLLETREEAQQALRGLENHLEGRLTIAATPLWCVYVLPTVLARIRSRYPRVEFRVLNGNTAQIGEMLADHRAELGLVSSVTKRPKIEQELCWKTPLVLVCHPRHRFGRREVVPMREVVSEPLATYQQTSDTWRTVERLWAQYQAVPNVAMEVNQIEAAKAMVLNGTCVALLPWLAVLPDVEAGRLVRVEVPELRSVHTLLYMAYASHKSSSLLVRLMREQLSEGKFELAPVGQGAGLAK